MKEVWIHINNTQGKYMISNNGKVKSFMREKPVLLKPRITIDGYKSVGIKENGKRSSKCIHRIVAENFIVKPFEGAIVNHIDGNKLNNNVDNLEWCDYTHNNQHAFKTGLKKVQLGSQSANSKLKEYQVLNIRKLIAKGHGPTDIARTYGVNPTTVYDIKSGKTWSWLKNNESQQTLDSEKED